MNLPFINKLLDYDSSGARPPVPGQESKKHKVTEPSQSEPHILMTSSSSSRSSSSPPSCFKWTTALSHLLEDRDGVELFKKYVEEQECQIESERLNFYFACEGLKQQSEGEKVNQIIGAIYRFLRKSQLHIPEDIRQTIKLGLKDKDKVILKPDLFDRMQSEVEQTIENTTYRNFLQSDLYISYVNKCKSAMDQFPTSSRSAAASYHTNPPSSHNTSTNSPSISDASLMFLSRSSTLPTLHEEGDFTNTDEVGAVGGYPEHSYRVPTICSSSTSSIVPMSLTKDALMATQTRRLEIRPPGAHGISAYTNYTSYNTVSRRDSELASMSSGRTDSDKLSISSMSTDSRIRKHQQSQQNAAERKAMREEAQRNLTTDFRGFLPRTMTETKTPMPLTPQQLFEQLIPKLQELKLRQESGERLHRLHEMDSSSKEPPNLNLDLISQKLMLDEVKTDQDILDHHMTLWGESTPGTISPCNQPQRRRHHDMITAPSGSNQSSMRSSKSLSDSNMRKNSRWGSTNTDSGISLFSSDTMATRPRDTWSLSGTSSTGSNSRLPRTPMLPPDSIPMAKKTTTQQIEEARRSRRYQNQPPIPPLQKNMKELPPIPGKNSSLPASTSGPVTANFTEVKFTFCDEQVPYLIKIPGVAPVTLKQVKDNLPKKGNFRFFFRTHCDDIENPVIKVERYNDSDVLPLFEGKIIVNVTKN